MDHRLHNELELCMLYGNTAQVESRKKRPCTKVSCRVDGNGSEKRNKYRLRDYPMNGYLWSVGGTKVSLIVRAFTQRIRFR